jgi:hypothetical protein
MSATNPQRHFDLKAVRRLAGALALGAGSMALSGAPVYAGLTPGEQFVYDWVETSGNNVGLTGMVDFTIGTALTTKPGWYSLSTFDVTASGGFCGICTPETLVLVGAEVDGATLGVSGEITGTYLNTKGTNHTFDLMTTDLPGGTWTYLDTGPNNVTLTSMGTYTVVGVTTRADEPPIALLLVPAGAALLLSRRRSRPLTAT